MCGTAVGLTDADVEHFFAGPSLLPWNRMGNIKQWLGPLPEGWMESHRVLQQKILQRMRELGMRPILPGFSGLVPDAMKAKCLLRTIIYDAFTIIIHTFVHLYFT